MNTSLKQKRRFRAAARGVFRAGLLALLAAPGSGLLAADNADSRVLWSAHDRSLAIVDGDDAAHRELCPKKADARLQPFCRKFTAPLLVASGDSGHVQLVLRNGEIHHLDSALIAADGSMRPAVSPASPMQLVSAWIPREECRPEQHLATVFAMDQAGHLWQFDGRQWRTLAVRMQASFR